MKVSRLFLPFYIKFALFLCNAAGVVGMHRDMAMCLLLLLFGWWWWCRLLFLFRNIMHGVNL